MVSEWDVVTDLDTDVEAFAWEAQLAFEDLAFDLAQPPVFEVQEVVSPDSKPSLKMLVLGSSSPSIEKHL